MWTVEGIRRKLASGVLVRIGERWYAWGMKTGFGVQFKPVKMLAPRSCHYVRRLSGLRNYLLTLTGQMKYLC